MDMQKIGNFLAELRKRKNLTQERAGRTNRSDEQDGVKVGERQLFAARGDVANAEQILRSKHQRIAVGRALERRAL